MADQLTDDQITDSPPAPPPSDPSPYSSPSPSPDSPPAPPSPPSTPTPAPSPSNTPASDEEKHSQENNEYSKGESSGMSAGKKGCICHGPFYNSFSEVISSSWIFDFPATLIGDSSIIYYVGLTVHPLMAIRVISRSKLPILTSVFVKDLIKLPIKECSAATFFNLRVTDLTYIKSSCDSCTRQFRDGRPRGSLWRGKKLLGKEALFVIQGLKRLKDDEELLKKFIKTHILRLLKMDMIAVLTELERQEEVSLSAKMFKIMQQQDWYKPDVFLYKDLIVGLARSKKMEEAMELWESMRKENLFPDSQTYTEVIRGFLTYGSPADAMNIYEDMKKSPDPPEELPFRILLKGLLPHPLLRNRVKQDFEEIFPDHHVYDPPEEIFGLN